MDKEFQKVARVVIAYFAEEVKALFQTVQILHLKFYSLKLVYQTTSPKTEFGPLL